MASPVATPSINALYFDRKLFCPVLNPISRVFPYFTTSLFHFFTVSLHFFTVSLHFFTASLFHCS
jgi:hypothetical protein